ncbi:arabinogalactan oligomer/maltooligosaccharide transport system substrate-binding protein [Paenibacillus sp. SORGH_AS306]|uniref:sugar ABC transporter substrate-binding protein n=1 Tax=unclassified Paenibacillus TaxID=185978 RepID=UPI00277F803F|nr:MULTISPECIES: maltose ABC transporter substrate-binding protein [unclassified Paenibacillus]MDQ1233949.1 arabinogalactan oligomer/maltooligosaccharide transport system substrate-binding protein [Paenibacillus sp. SORGH_AS_0306]MDR6110994.1 arabinogalactan oligomer/maltooligosaccharide transport system substrate-binding protein [Paenibacillus sp. SORGH_AS_0338]
MMNRKKWGIMSCLLIMMLLVSACNSGGAGTTTPGAATDSQVPADQQEMAPEEGAKLTVWDSGDQKTFIEAAAKAFKEKYNVDVSFAEVGPDKSMGQMVTDGPAGVGGDVFAGVHDQIGQGVSAGVVLPNDWFEEDTKSRNSEIAIKALTYDNMLYGYPKSVETTAVFYNKDLIKEVPQDWNGVIDFAKTFNDTKANKFAIMWEVGNGYYVFPFIGGYGSYVFGSDGTDAKDIGLNNPAAVEAATFIQGLNKILPLKTSDINADIKKSLFTSNKLAMNISGPWDTGSLKESVKNIGVGMYPNLPNGKPMTPFSGVKAYFVNAYTKYPNASKLFADFITSEEWQTKNFEMNGALPSNTKAAASEQVQSDPIATVFLKQFENSVPMPSIPAMAQFWSPMEAAMSSIWNDNKDPKAALDNLVSQMKSNIETGQ